MKFLQLLKYFKDNEREMVIVINGEKKRVKVQDIKGDIVTLYEQEGRDRYDMHYTQVIIWSLKQ